MQMFAIFKLSFDEDILAFLGLATVLVTFSKFGHFFPKLLATVVTRVLTM
jgi:hypothetical protein